VAGDPNEERRDEFAAFEWLPKGNPLRNSSEKSPAERAPSNRGSIPPLPSRHCPSTRSAATGSYRQPRGEEASPLVTALRGIPRMGRYQALAVTVWILHPIPTPHERLTSRRRPARPSKRLRG
jgi:hypothetical protein